MQCLDLNDTLSAVSQQVHCRHGESVKYYPPQLFQRGRSVDLNSCQAIEPSSSGRMATKAQQVRWYWLLLHSSAPCEKEQV
jgi:hypothetical protein